MMIMSYKQDDHPDDSLPKLFKIKIALLAFAVVISLLFLLSYLSIQGCPAYFLNFPMRSTDCDASNVLALSAELTVAGIFAIIISLIFYEKQKIGSSKLQKLATDQLQQTMHLNKIQNQINDFEFEQNRLTAIRIMARYFNELHNVLQIIMPQSTKGPYRNTSDLEKRDELVDKIREVIDNVTLSKDPSYSLVRVIEQLLADIKNTPKPGDVVKINSGKFTINGSQDFESLLLRINTVQNTLSGVQREIIKKIKHSPDT